jgi:NAD(P)H-nitrite reductase large subunit
MFEEKTDNSIKRLFVKDGVLTGFIFIGGTDRAGIYTSLIREKTPLDSIDFDTLRHVATFTAFSRESRGKKFGGVV